MISVYGGVAWQNIAYHEQVVAAPNQQVTSALIVGKISLFRFDKTNLDVVATACLPFPTRAYPHQSQRRLLHQALEQVYVELFLLRQLGQSAPSSFSSSDYGTSSGITYRFGNR